MGARFHRPGRPVDEGGSPPANRRRAGDRGPADDAQQALSAARRGESSHAIAGALTLASTEAELAVSPDDLDADPYLLNCANGTLDLRTMTLRDHDPADLLTKVTRAAWHPDAASEEWDAFLARVQPDEEMRGYLARLTGHGLEGQGHRAPAPGPLRRRGQRQVHVHRNGGVHARGLRGPGRPGSADRPHLRRTPDRCRRPVRPAAGHAARDRPGPPPGRGHRQEADRRGPDQGPRGCARTSGRSPPATRS